MSNDEHKQVYWDIQQNQFYWIEWVETGNNDIPIKHYIEMHADLRWNGAVYASEDMKQ